jgi:hypothetical protein
MLGVSSMSLSTSLVVLSVAAAGDATASALVSFFSPFGLLDEDEEKFLLEMRSAVGSGLLHVLLHVLVCGARRGAMWGSSLLQPDMDLALVRVKRDMKEIQVGE